MKYAQEIVQRDVKPDQLTIWTVDNDSEEPSLKASYGLPRDFSEKNDNFGGPDSFLAEAYNKKQRIYVDDLENAQYQDTRFPGLNKPSGAFLAVPLLSDDDRVLGLMNFYRKKRNGFTPDDIEYISKIAEQIAICLHNILVFEHTKEMSITDELTDTFNRRYFNQRYEGELQRAKRYKRSLVVIMLDIDHFKAYNDLNGHLTGDKVLQKVAATLKGILRKADMLARFGGEEFVIMLPEISKAQARKVANKLRRKIAKTQFENEASQPNGKITISLGLAVYPEDTEDAQLLIQYADDAMYTAKTQGRNCVAWHGMKLSGKRKRRASEAGAKVATT